MVSAFDIHSPGELAAILGARIRRARGLERSEEAIVLLLELDDGSRWVYKRQLGPPLEAAFYEGVDCGLLPECRVLEKRPDVSALLLRWVEGTPLAAAAADPAAVLGICARIHDAIGRLEGRAPCRWKLRIADDLLALYEALLDDLILSLAERPLSWGAMESLNLMQSLCLRPMLAEAWNGRIGLIHGDLHADNVFCLPAGGLKVIDWQTPMVGPLGIDQAFLLESLGIDPGPVVGMETVFAMHALSLCMAVDSYLWLLKRHGSVLAGALETTERYMAYRAGGILGNARPSPDALPA